MSAPGQSPLDPLRRSDPVYSGPLVPERATMPNWMKWAAVMALALGVGLVNVQRRPDGKVYALDVVRQELISVGIAFGAGKTKFE